MKYLSLVAAVVICIAGAPANANILNGDFEASGPNGFGAWELSPVSRIFRLKGSDYSDCCFYSPANSSAASLSNSFAAFGPGGEDPTGIISQTVALRPGSYTLGFDFGAVGRGQYFHAVTARVTSGLSTVSRTVGSSGSPSSGTPSLDLTFTRFTIEFISTGSPVIFAFETEGTINGGVDGLLDNVTLSSVVPEPSTWAMLIAGFGFVGFVQRRRQAAVAA